MRIRKAGSLEFTLLPGVRVAIYDAKGQVVRTFNVSRTGKVSWDLTNERGMRVPAGLYFIRIPNQEAAGTRKLILLN